jgi:putative transposase
VQKQKDKVIYTRVSSPAHHQRGDFITDSASGINFQRRGLKTNRRINSKTARAMCTWSHYRFRCHLIQKVRCRPSAQVRLVTEEFTSKTCGKKCGALHPKLGGSKTYKCADCKTVMDRDSNGARNVLLKHLTELTARVAEEGTRAG